MTFSQQGFRTLVVYTTYHQHAVVCTKFFMLAYAFEEGFLQPRPSGTVAN